MLHDNAAIAAAKQRALEWWRAADAKDRAAHKFHIMRRVATDRLSGRAHCAVISVLIDGIRDDGTARASAHWLAEACNLSLNVAASALADLQFRGIVIEIDRGGTDRGGKRQPKIVTLYGADGEPEITPRRKKVDGLDGREPPIHTGVVPPRHTGVVAADHPPLPGGIHPGIPGGHHPSTPGGYHPGIPGRSSLKPPFTIPEQPLAAREREEFLKLAPIYARLFQTFGRKHGVEMRIDADALAVVEKLLADMCCSNGVPAPLEIVDEAIWHIEQTAAEDPRGWPRTFPGLAACLRRAGWPRIPVPEDLVEQLGADGAICRRSEVAATRTDGA